MKWWMFCWTSTKVIILSPMLTLNILNNASASLSCVFVYIILCMLNFHNFFDSKLMAVDYLLNRTLVVLKQPVCNVRHKSEGLYGHIMPISGQFCFLSKYKLIFSKHIPVIPAFSSFHAWVIMEQSCVWLNRPAN